MVLLIKISTGTIVRLKSGDPPTMTIPPLTNVLVRVAIPIARAAVTSLIPSPVFASSLSERVIASTSSNPPKILER